MDITIPVGTRVTALLVDRQSREQRVVCTYGRGTYQGLRPIPQEYASLALPGVMAPYIQLDSGAEFWGFEGVWGRTQHIELMYGLTDADYAKTLPAEAVRITRLRAMEVGRAMGVPAYGEDHMESCASPCGFHTEAPFATDVDIAVVTQFAVNAAAA